MLTAPKGRPKGRPRTQGGTATTSFATPQQGTMSVPGARVLNGVQITEEEYLQWEHMERPSESEPEEMDQEQAEMLIKLHRRAACNRSELDDVNGCVRSRTTRPNSFLSFVVAM